MIKVHGEPHASDVVVLAVQVSENTIDLIEALKLEGTHEVKPEIEVTIAVD